jgi:hypothetical protein
MTMGGSALQICFNTVGTFDALFHELLDGSFLENIRADLLKPAVASTYFKIVFCIVRSHSVYLQDRQLELPSGSQRNCESARGRNWAHHSNSLGGPNARNDEIIASGIHRGACDEVCPRP